MLKLKSKLAQFEILMLITWFGLLIAIRNFQCYKTIFLVLDLFEMIIENIIENIIHGIIKIKELKGHTNTVV